MGKSHIAVHTPDADFPGTDGLSAAVGIAYHQCAGIIHTDFEKGFIRAEIVPFDTLVELGSMAACKEKGLVRSEGKEYVMKDGDITLFRFNV